MSKRKTKSIYISEDLFNRLKIRANGTQVPLKMLSEFLLNEGLKTLKTIQLPMKDKYIAPNKTEENLTEEWEDD